MGRNNVQKLSQCEIEFYFDPEGYGGVLEIAALEGHTSGELQYRIMERAYDALEIVLSKRDIFEKFRAIPYSKLTPENIDEIRSLFNYPKRISQTMEQVVRYG